MMSERNVITLPVWNPTFKFKNRVPFSMLISGARGSGKSYFNRWLLNAKLITNTDRFYIFCNNRQEIAKYLDALGVRYYNITQLDKNNTFKFGPGSTKTVSVYEQFEQGVIKTLMAYNNARIANKLKPARILIIFDDSFGSAQKHSDELNQIYCTGRHFEISCIFLMQYFKQSGTMFRGNSDYTIISKQKISADYMFLAKEIVSGSLEMSDDTRNQNRIYANILKEHTKNQGDLIIFDTTGAPENEGNELFKFRAP